MSLMLLYENINDALEIRCLCIDIDMYEIYIWA
jgi:hypothetical protein